MVLITQSGAVTFPAWWWVMRVKGQADERSPRSHARLLSGLPRGLLAAQPVVVPVEPIGIRTGDLVHDTRRLVSRWGRTRNRPRLSDVLPPDELKKSSSTSSSRLH